MRFYLDEDLSPKVAEIGRSAGLDVVSSHECGQNGKSDEEQLLFPAAQARCLVTCNGDHFIALLAPFFERSLPHAGVLVITPQNSTRDFGSVVDALRAYEHAHIEGMSAYGIDFIHLSRG